jgi:hypothetical protein
MGPGPEIPIDPDEPRRTSEPRGRRTTYGRRTVRANQVLRDLFRGRINRRIIAQVIKMIARGIITNPIVVGVIGGIYSQKVGEAEPTEEEISEAVRRWEEYIASGGQPGPLEQGTVTPEDIIESRGEVLERIEQEEREQLEREAIERAWQERFGTPAEQEADPFYKEIIRELMRERGNIPEAMRRVLEEREARDREQDVETERRIGETERNIRREMEERYPVPAPQQPAREPAPPQPTPPTARRTRLPLILGLGGGALAVGLFRGGRSRSYTTSTGAVVRGGLTDDQNGGVPYYPTAAFAPGAAPSTCPTPKKRRPRGDCLERAPVNWASGRYRGKRAGMKCIRWKR